MYQFAHCSVFDIGKPGIFFQKCLNGQFGPSSIEQLLYSPCVFFFFFFTFYCQSSCFPFLSNRFLQLRTWWTSHLSTGVYIFTVCWWVSLSLTHKLHFFIRGDKNHCTIQPLDQKTFTFIHLRFYVSHVPMFYVPIKAETLTEKKYLVSRSGAMFTHPGT